MKINVSKSGGKEVADHPAVAPSQDYKSGVLEMASAWPRQVTLDARGVLMYNVL